jgi:asparagine synthase (glutamine-hydrolysing)
MCGISGVVNCGNREVLARMTHVQAHRGPDDSGLWEQRFPDGSYVGFGSRRLAILDLSPHGHMPMANETRSVWITYNGEIYNFAELRTELQGKGYTFRSDTDTEVVLHLYEEEGPECVKRLNGMFAFAICDMRESSPLVFMARDHFGIKPFYYWFRGRRMAFASEIKALLEVPGIEAQMDLEALHRYLTFLWVPGSKTMFRGITKLSAGHCATLRSGVLKIERYWDLKFPPRQHQFHLSEAELIEEVRDRFQRSVEGQMVSDVPVGAFLSAGLDSSSIVALMAKTAKRPLRTYTITFPEKYRVGESTIDDPNVPARLANFLGCENERITVEPDVTQLLPMLTWHMDEPTADPALIPAYLVCREARKQATVLLSGVGGDELFAGYRKHVAHAFAQTYQRVPAGLREVAERALLGLPSLRGTRMKGPVRLAKKMARSGSLTPAEQFVMNGTYLDAEQKMDLYTDELNAQMDAYDPAVEHFVHFERVRDADFLNQMLYLDTKIFMTTLNLTYNDKMSMASSVEVRVPFLDRELAEFVAWDVPPVLKLRGGLRPTTKYIFREAMRPLLPPEVLEQPKAGFAAPVDYWLAHDLREIVEDLLSETQVRQRGWFRPAAVQKLVEEQRNGTQDWSMQIWQLLTLEIWTRLFIDGGSRSFAEERIQSQQAATA